VCLTGSPFFLSSLNRPTTSASPTESERDESNNDAALIQRLRKSGKLEKIQHDFTAKLVQCGWRDDLKDVAKDAVRDNGGITQVTLDQISAVVVPHGYDTVPPILREKVMQQVRQAIREEKQT
jgi:enhancer of yellow 2 transcription factor